ncbi:phosphoadenosine phosphosulfate reductase family protein [Maridesulfovibrio hydrothermalis]|uniref:phosphoadenosine phosphosulfate reductase family protein n=1 Tax=Maridesulfovibrio hydrothermalis TaxID=191026 RepID=UPI0004832BF6|nr:phosphoadenosine phosphosulfate reductase family protein [Maridesulfovibrio hydrothermalis]
MTEITATCPLDAKITHSAGLMSGMLEMYDPARIAVAWTGGKDSTVVLALLREVMKAKGLETPLALSIDTGVKFSEVMAFRDRLALEWGVEVKVIRPDVDIKLYPVAEDPVTCCADLKIKPLQKAIEDFEIDLLLTGIRRDEHPSRAGRKYLEVRNDPDHTLLNPILEWTEMDIWSFTTMHRIPHCELYDQGYRSLGCKPCTALAGSGSEREGRSAGKEKNLELLTSLGYF